MTKLRVTNVDTFIQGDKKWYRVRYESQSDSNGPLPPHFHCFPEEAIEGRMAEYGFDDVEEALDIVLSEPFLEVDPGPALFTAATAEEARSGHRTRCAEAKLRMRISSRGPENPLEMIRSDFRINPEAIAEKRMDFLRCQSEYRRVNRG